MTLAPSYSLSSRPRAPVPQLAIKWLGILLATLTFSVATASIVHAAEPQGAVKHQEQTVNINTASADELAATLRGVGESKAQAIVDHRELNGLFSSLEQLTDVRGIGAATLEKNKELLSL